MTAEQARYRSIIAREVKKQEARTSLTGFRSRFKPEDRIPQFHDYLGSRLSALFRGEILRLMIEMPPGRAKSEYASRYGPAFGLGVNPRHKILACSYGSDLASRMNRDVQAIMAQEEYTRIFPNSKMGGERVKERESLPLRNTTEFEVSDKAGQITGGYRCAGVGSGITGWRFSIGGIDDPVKGFEAAWSETQRETTWHWFQTEFYSRRLPDAGIYIVGTRWHEDDLIGRLKKKQLEDPKADKWEVITFPEIIEPGYDIPSYDERKAGELLWPERYGKEDYDATRLLYDSYQYSALYQQNPTAREGNAIKREWFEDGTPSKYCMFFNHEDVLQVRLAYDVAFTDSPDGDWTWGSLKAKMKDGSFLTLWQHFGHWSNEKRRANIGAFGLQVKAMMQAMFPNISWLLTEEAGVGPGVDVTKEDISYLVGLGLPAQKFEIKKQAKAARAVTWLSACEARRTKLYAGGQLADFGMSDGTNRWINPFMNAVLRLRYSEDGLEFKGGKDDMVDAEVEAHEGLCAPPKRDFFSRN